MAGNTRALRERTVPDAPLPWRTRSRSRTNRAGGWWKLWQAPSRGQRLAATGLLLLNVLFLGAHVLLLRDLAPVLIGLLVLDAVLAALAWTPVGVVPVLARAGLGVVLAWMLFEPDTLPFLGISQVVLSVSLGVLLVHRFGGAFWLLAVPGPLLCTVLGGGLVCSLATANAYATFMALWLTGAIEPQPVSRLEGRAEHYALSLPPGSWSPRARAQTDKLQVDVALFNPALEMNVAVAIQRIPQGVNLPGLERVERVIKTAMEQRKSGLKWGTPHELPGPWDEARGLSMRTRVGGLMHDSGEPAVERIATVLAVEPRLDLALLHLPFEGPEEGSQEGPRRAALSFREAPLAKDTPVVASDFPWNEPFQPGVFRSQPTLHLGTVTEPEALAPASYPDPSARLVQMAPGPLPRHSGGPVVDLDGAVVGMTVGAALSTKATFLVPSGRLLPFLKASGARTLEGTPPPAQADTDAFPAPVREALEAAMVSVLEPGRPPRVGVVVRVPGYKKGLVLTSAGSARAQGSVQVGFFSPATRTWRERPGTVLLTQPDQKNTPPTRLRVATDLGGLFKPGPAVDQEGALVGYALQGSEETGRVELVAAAPLRELLRGPVRAVAARAVRALQGDCQVEFFVDAQEGLSGPRMVSLAVAAPDPSREDALVPAFGPERDLGPLPRSGGRLRLPLPACAEGWLVYRLQLTSALGVQRVEGRLPLPARALERTQAPAPLASEEGVFKLRDFLEWKAEPAAVAPPRPRRPGPA